MSEWELDDDQNEWQLDQTPLPPQEGIASSILKAPFRIAGDLFTSGIKGASHLPEYYQAAKTEVPGALDVITQHPIHALGQAAAGTAELAHKVLETPADIVDYASGRLNLLPKSVQGKFWRPENIEQGLEYGFGQPKYEGEKLIRGAIRNLPEIYGAGIVGKSLNPLRYTNKAIIKDVLNARTANKNKYSKMYNDFFSDTKEKGFDNLSDAIKNINWEDIKKYTPDTKLTKINKFIENPTNETAHYAKSDLNKIARNIEKKETLIGGESDQYRAITDAVDKIENNMFKNKEGMINENLKNRYDTLQQGYKENVVPYTTNKAIKDYLNKDLLEKELVQKLSRGKFAAKVGKRHDIGTRENIANTLKWLGIGGGLGAGATAGYNFLTNE